MVLPQRTSLVAQVAEFVRQRLQAGEWKLRLPGEHQLCEQLQVSRPTLRKALAVLGQEGWIHAERGLGWRILTTPVASAPRGLSRKIGLVCFLPLESASHLTLFLIDKLQDHLHRAGYETEIHASAQYTTQNYEKALDRIVTRSQASRWILLGPTLKVQQWFVARKLPAFVSLTSHGKISLPSLHVDTQALYRHAVGMLLRRGHLRLVWFVPKLMTQRDEGQSHGFVEAVENYKKRSGFSARIVDHDGTPASIRQAIDSLYRSDPPPSVILAVRPYHCLAAVSHMSYVGIRVPQDVSVVCVGYEPFLENFTPRLAHYTIDRWMYARRLCRLTIAWITTGRSYPHSSSLLPQFFDGPSLASIP